MSLADLEAQASGPAVELARAILEQDLADRAWTAQIGPALSQRDTARLLDKSEQAVSKDRRLLRILNRDGRPAYPVMQFEGRGQLPGVADVVETLSTGFEPLSIAAWLTGASPDLDGRRPVDVLRGAEVAPALGAARRTVAAAG